MSSFRVKRFRKDSRKPNRNSLSIYYVRVSPMESITNSFLVKDFARASELEIS